MDRQYVGIDFHRRRSVIVRLSASGERLGVTRVANEASEFVMLDAGPEPRVVIEATYGWYWAVDFLQEFGATVPIPQDRPTACREQSPRRDRPQGPHARLLRPARRRDTLPRPGPGRRVRLGHGPVARSTIGKIPATS